MNILNLIPFSNSCKPAIIALPAPKAILAVSTNPLATVAPRPVGLRILEEGSFTSAMLGEKIPLSSPPNLSCPDVACVPISKAETVLCILKSRFSVLLALGSGFPFFHA